MLEVDVGALGEDEQELKAPAESLDKTYTSWRSAL